MLTKIVSNYPFLQLSIYLWLLGLCGWLVGWWIWFDLVFCWATPILRTYFWVRAQGSLLAMLRRAYGMLGTEPRSNVCQLPTVLFSCPVIFFFFKEHEWYRVWVFILVGVWVLFLFCILKGNEILEKLTKMNKNWHKLCLHLNSQFTPNRVLSTATGTFQSPGGGGRVSAPWRRSKRMSTFLLLPEEIRTQGLAARLWHCNLLGGMGDQQPHHLFI